MTKKLPMYKFSQALASSNFHANAIMDVLEIQLRVKNDVSSLVIQSFKMNGFYLHDAELSGELRGFQILTFKPAEDACLLPEDVE